MLCGCWRCVLRYHSCFRYPSLFIQTDTKKRHESHLKAIFTEQIIKHVWGMLCCFPSSDTNVLFFEQRKTKCAVSLNNRTAGPQAHPSLHFDLQRLLRDKRKRADTSPWAADHCRLTASAAVWLWSLLLDVWWTIQNPSPRIPHSPLFLWMQLSATDWERWVSCGMVDVMLRGCVWKWPCPPLSSQDRGEPWCCQCSQ